MIYKVIKFCRRYYQWLSALLIIPFLMLLFTITPVGFFDKIPFLGGLQNTLLEQWSIPNLQTFLGVTLSYLGFIVSVLVLKRVDKKNLKSMDEFLEAANQVLQSIDDSRTLNVTSPTIFIGGNYKWNEFKIFKNNFERLSKNNRKMNIYCLEFDKTKLDDFLNLSYDELIKNSHFDGCSLFDFHTEIFEANSKSDNPTKKHKYFKELFLFLKKISDNQNANFTFLDKSKLGESNLISFSNGENKQLLASYVLKDIDGSLFNNEKTVGLIDSFVDSYRAQNI